MAKQIILFFDGHCNLCNASVDFVLRRDRRMKIFVASLQGETAREALPDDLRTTIDSLVLKVDDQWYTHSTAALRCAKHLGFPWSMAVVFLIVPRFIRDGVYRYIARNRYKWFGRNDTCRMPTEEEKARFLP